MDPTADPSVRQSEILFQRINSGDDSAWNELYSACQPKLVRAVRRRLTGRPRMRSLFDSMDFTNEVWKSITANWDRYQFANIHALIAFMSREAECKVVDQLRRLHSTKRDPSRETRIESMQAEGDRPFEAVSNDPTPSQVIIAEETEAKIMEGGTTEAKREAIRMRQENYSTEEIARTLNWHPRGIQRFFQKLAQTVTGADAVEVD